MLSTTKQPSAQFSRENATTNQASVLQSQASAALLTSMTVIFLHELSQAVVNTILWEQYQQQQGPESSLSAQPPFRKMPQPS